MAPFKKFKETIFYWRQIFEKEHNDTVHGLVKMIMNKFYLGNMLKDLIEEPSSKTEYWMSTEYDEIVLRFWKLQKVEYVVEIKLGWRFRMKNRYKNTMRVRLGSSVLSNCKRSMKNFVYEIDGFKTIIVYYTDTCCLFFEKIIGMSHMKLILSEMVCVKVGTIFKLVVFLIYCFSHLK